MDRKDQGLLPQAMAPTYAALHWLVSDAMRKTHIEGELKSAVMACPESFVERDPDMARTLMDQRLAVSFPA